MAFSSASSMACKPMLKRFTPALRHASALCFRQTFRIGFHCDFSIRQYGKTFSRVRQNTRNLRTFNSEGVPPPKKIVDIVTDRTSLWRTYKSISRQRFST